jgi:hypothetical protein
VGGGQEKGRNQRKGERAMEWKRGGETSLERQEWGKERKTMPERAKKERRREVEKESGEEREKSEKEIWRERRCGRGQRRRPRKGKSEKWSGAVNAKKKGRRNEWTAVES